MVLNTLKGRFAYVSEIFYSIQGEGPFLGLPSLFIRLSFCNLSCSFCDTKDKLKRYKKYSLSRLISLSKNYKNITITGGEPFIQIDFLKRYIKSIYNKNLIIETNGLIVPKKDFLKLIRKKNVFFIISPKIRILDTIKIWQIISKKYNLKTFFKFLIFNKNNFSNFKSIIKILNLENVYLQPVDLKKDNYIKFSKECINEFLKEYKKLKNKIFIRPQIHKILKMR